MKRMSSKATLAMVLIATGVIQAVTVQAAQDEPQLLKTELGTVGGQSSEGTAINDRGQVAGTSESSEGAFHAFFWDHGKITDIPPLRGFDSYTNTLNNRGQVLGYFNAGPSGEEHAFLWERGTTIDLGTLGGAYSLPPAPGLRALNDHGQAVVDSTTAEGAWRAAVWQNGKMTSLGTLPGGTFSTVSAINNRGQVVGSSQTAAGENHAFLWDNGTMFDLGTLGGTSSSARAVNDDGQVVGDSLTASGERHAFLWTDGTMIDLGTPGSISYALGINRRGQVLVYTESGAMRRTFLWEDGTTTDLGTLPGRTSAIGYALNDRGQVVGNSFTLGEASPSSAFLWQGGTMIELSRLPGGDVSLAFDVNQHGDVTGWSSAGRDDYPRQHGVLWTHRRGEIRRGGR